VFRVLSSFKENIHQLVLLQVLTTMTEENKEQVLLLGVGSCCGGWLESPLIEGSSIPQT
jgi:hypothetical protein